MENILGKTEQIVLEKLFIDMRLPNLTPSLYLDTPEHKSTIEYGKYLVVRKDGKKHFETFNGTSWAYNNNSIIAYYLPKIN
jgi:hypothetical protein